MEEFVIVPVLVIPEIDKLVLNSNCVFISCVSLLFWQYMLTLVVLF